MRTPAQKWSEQRRPASPEVDALEAEYSSKITTRLRIFALARKLEAERDALKALNAELAEALSDMVHYDDLRASEQAPALKKARAALAKVR